MFFKDLKDLKAGNVNAEAGRNRTLINTPLTKQPELCEMEDLTGFSRQNDRWHYYLQPAADSLSVTEYLPKQFFRTKGHKMSK
jgi:hypothetical protein